VALRLRIHKTSSRNGPLKYLRFLVLQFSPRVVVISGKLRIALPFQQRKKGSGFRKLKHLVVSGTALHDCIANLTSNRIPHGQMDANLVLI
jgi:hypothetical protein